MLLHATFSPGRKCLRYVNIRKAGRVSGLIYLCDLAPTVARIAHLLESLFFLGSPWGVGSAPFLAIVVREQRRYRNVRRGFRW